MASPRLCVMKKGESGYGFHLHGEKGKSGQYIRKVERASAAEASGLRAGDRVLEVNGVNVERETHHQVVQRIKAVEQETRLLVVDRETDELFRSLRLTSSRAPPSPASSSRAPPSPASSKRGEMIKPVRKAPSRAAKKEEVSAELLPRLCHLVHSHTGYGFNLHSERSRPGQYIRALDPDSPADRAGLKPQDRLIEVNGVNIEGMRHSEVVSFIKNGGAQTHLLVVDPDTDEHFKKIGIVPTSIHVKDFDESITNGSSSPHVNGSRAAHTDTQEAGLCLSSTAAEAKEKAHAKRSRRRAPPMDWSQKHQLFSNF